MERYEDSGQLDPASRLVVPMSNSFVLLHDLAIALDLIVKLNLIQFS